MKPKQTIGKRLLSIQKRKRKIGIKKTIAEIREIAAKMFEPEYISPKRKTFSERLEEEMEKKRVKDNRLL